MINVNKIKNGYKNLVKLFLNSLLLILKLSSVRIPGYRQPGSKSTNKMLIQFYEFVWKWEDLYKYHTKPGVQAALEYMNKDKSSYNLAFEPT